MSNQAMGMLIIAGTAVSGAWFVVWPLVKTILRAIFHAEEHQHHDFGGTE